MQFKQIYTPGLAQCSYVIGGKNSCLVVDPSRDIEKYLDIAASFNLPIIGIIETHLHADFVSGHMELAAKTGATIYITKKAVAAYEHYGMSNGEEITLDSLRIKMLDTPGHTPESAVFIVSDLERGSVPVLVFTGDTLLVGDAGRPDLFPNIKKQLASSLYDSLREIENIGDHVEIYPAHGAGSLCGKALSSKLLSTIGTERMYNPAITIESKEEFISSFLEDMPEAPDHFSRCSEINRKGPAVTANIKKPLACSPKEFYKLAQSQMPVVDTRDMLAFGAAHVPGAYGLSLQGNFSTFGGWVLPPDKPLLLVAENEKDLSQATKMLYRVGLDTIHGYLKGGMAAYAQSGLKTSKLESISAAELKERLDKEKLILIDTRLKSEYEAEHIAGAVHAPAPDVRWRYKEWVGDRDVAFICNTGNRSLLAASLMLQRSGMKNIVNVIGGTPAWSNAGYDIIKNVKE
jgi:glyoxylase-like metal-dependent hydrolase (beta-lactamase superfamily II)/rhodanese-related sulfurtransferase